MSLSVDANNVTLTPEMVPGDFIVELNEAGSNKYNWAMLLNSPSIAWPLTITVNSIPALTDPYAPSTFKVNVGENPVNPDRNGSLIRMCRLVRKWCM